MPLIDYLLAAHIGALLRRLGLPFRFVATDSLAACRRISAGDDLEPRELADGMDSAEMVWMVTTGMCLVLTFVLMIFVGQVFGRPSLGGPLGIVPCLGLGAFTFAASSYGFAVTRSRFLYDGVLAPRGGRWAERLASSLSTPKRRDAVVGMVAAIGVVLLSFLEVITPTA
jgi:hypothetical protein